MVDSVCFGTPFPLRARKLTDFGIIKDVVDAANISIVQNASLKFDRDYVSRSVRPATLMV